MPLNEPYDWESPEQFETRQLEQLMMPMPQEDRELLELIGRPTPDSAAAPPSDYGNVPTAREELPQGAFVQPGYEYGQTIEGIPGSPPAPPAQMDLATTTRAQAQAEIAASYGIGKEAIPQRLLPQDPGELPVDEDQAIRTVGGEIVADTSGPPARRLEPPAPTSTQDAQLQRAERAAAPSAPVAPGTREQRRELYATGIAKTGSDRADILIKRGLELKAQGREEHAAQFFSTGLKLEKEALLDEAQTNATTRAKNFHTNRTTELADLHQQKADSNYFKKSSTGGKIAMILMGMMGGWLQSFRQDGKNIGLEYLNKMIERWADEEQENYSRQKDALEDKRNMFIDSQRIEQNEINYRQNVIVRMEKSLKTEMDQIGRKYGHLESALVIQNAALELGEQTAEKIEGMHVADEARELKAANRIVDMKLSKTLARIAAAPGLARVALDRDKFDADEGRRAWADLTKFSATGQQGDVLAVPFLAGGPDSGSKGNFKPKSEVAPEERKGYRKRHVKRDDVRRMGLNLMSMMTSGGRIYDGPFSGLVTSKNSRLIKQALETLKTDAGVEAFGTTSNAKQDARLISIVGNYDTFLQAEVGANYALIRSYVKDMGAKQYSDDRHHLRPGFKDVRKYYTSPSLDQLTPVEPTVWGAAQTPELEGILKTYGEEKARATPKQMPGVGVIKEELLPPAAPAGPAPRLPKEAPGLVKKAVDNALKIARNEKFPAEDRWNALKGALDKAYQVWEASPPPKIEEPPLIKEVGYNKYIKQMKRSRNAETQFYRIRKFTSNFIAETSERDLNITVDGKTFETNAEADRAIGKKYPHPSHKGIPRGTAKKYAEGFQKKSKYAEHATEKAIAKVEKGHPLRSAWRRKWKSLTRAEMIFEHKRLGTWKGRHMSAPAVTNEPPKRKQDRLDRLTRE